MNRAYTLLAAALVITFSVALMWYGLPGWALLVVYLGYLGVALFNRYRRTAWGLAKLKAERPEETFDTFFERLNRPDYDRTLVWTVYIAVRSLAEGVALRPYDDLVADLKIDRDDVDQALFVGLKDKLGLVDSAAAFNANPHRNRRNTVGGLIDFFANHPKLQGQASTAPSTPSALST